MIKVGGITAMPPPATLQSRNGL